MSEITELTQQVADLTTSTTNLTNTVVGQVERLSADVAITDQKATEAANSAIAAEDSAVAANTHKANAKVEADRAKSEADNAASVVTGGTATLNSEAGKIPLADSDGKIDLSWLPAEAQGYNAFAQEQAVNGDKFAASGFVHMGAARDKGPTVSPINQGLYTYTTLSNKLSMGVLDGADSVVGDSKSLFAKTNIAGITSNLSALKALTGTRSHFDIKFPEAPNGTVTYDSATGVITDYTKDVDPKYGDVAPDVNEAVARSFEGEVKNGDFRFGDDGSWDDESGGVWTISNGYISCAGGTGHYRNTRSLDVGVEYAVEVEVTEKSAGLVYIYMSSGVGEWKSLNVGMNRYTMTCLGTEPVTVYSNGFVGKVSSISVRKVTTEVVTERVDMWGFEAWLEEVSQANPYVYQNGLIQSQASDIDGVSTGSSNRPDTYYAVFDGDTTSRGNGVNFWAISDAQRKAIFSNPDNKLYLIDGKIYQWRLRQRTIAGAGNGDWGSIDSNATGDLTLDFQGSTARVAGQGKSNVIVAPSGANYLASTHSQFNNFPEAGVFTSRNAAYSDGDAVYFLVCGTVSRLNQGAYHPSFNAMGAGYLSYDDAGGNTLGGNSWDFSQVDTSELSAKDCFIESQGGQPFSGAGVYVTSGGLHTGSIESNLSGRPDGRFYDAIYADGLGGVVLDMRYSAWDKSAPEHKAKALAMVENGTYRGVEKLKFTENICLSGVSQYDSDIRAVRLSRSDFDLLNLEADVSSSPVVSGSLTMNGVNYEVDYVWATGNLVIIYVFDSSVSNGGGQTVTNVVLSTEINHSVGGEFQLTEVIGDPANILTNPDLKEGWLGVWNPTIPVSSTLIPLSREALGASADVVYTSDNGIAWGATSVTLDGVNNTGSTWSAPSTAVYDYTIFAKQTKPSTNQTVFNGEAGVGSVFASASNEHSNLSETLFGSVLTYSGDVSYANRATVENVCTVLDGRLKNVYDGIRELRHRELSLGATEGVAFKTLTTQLSVNDQASIQFQYEELVYDGDWGDDGKMFITSTGDSTNTDTNGNTVKCGVHELAVPYGWCKVEV